MLKLNDIDVFAVLIAAMCHDYKHTGLTNNYEVNSKSSIALTYNGKFSYLFLDKSVLENHHISETFKTLLKSENNITSNLNTEQYNHFRRRIIDCILATDMAKHVKHIGQLRNKLETYNIKKGENVEKLINNENSAKIYKSKQIVLSFSIHSCDISSPAKIAKIYDEWIDLVFMEFFIQGDIEKNSNLPVTILCDRNTTDIVNSQIGFINFVGGGGGFVYLVTLFIRNVRW